MKDISIVIPCYNCEDTIEELNLRLINILNTAGKSFEIIYINDSSKDNSLTILKNIANNFSEVTAIDMMFNVGQFMATMCGLEQSSGKVVITMDDDLQHTPEDVLLLYSEMEKNNVDAIYASFAKKEHTIVRNIGSFVVRKINEKIFNKPQDIKMSSFRCLSRDLVETIVHNNTVSPVIGALINRYANRIINIEVKHEKRKYGKSNYTFTKLISLTLDHIFNFSSLPLKYISGLGIISSGLSFILGIIYFFRYLGGYIKQPGWTSLVLFSNFYSGLILLSIGVIGEYLIRILKEVNGSPRYKIRKIYKVDIDE